MYIIERPDIKTNIKTRAKNGDLLSEKSIENDSN